MAGERPGTVIVDIDQRFLYLVQGDDTAIRYAIGVGRQGFSWKGAAYVGRKSVWPNWSPTSNMVKLIPDLPRYASAGIDNPLGARALYLYQGGRDTSSASTAQRALEDRAGRLLRLHPNAERGRVRPLRARAGWRDGARQAEWAFSSLKLQAIGAGPLGCWRAGQL